jgi:hypothetical protein
MWQRHWCILSLRSTCLFPVPAVLIPIVVFEADFRPARRSSPIAAIVAVTINVLIVAARSPIATDRTMVFIHHQPDATGTVSVLEGVANSAASDDNWALRFRRIACVVANETRGPCAKLLNIHFYQKRCNSQFIRVAFTLRRRCEDTRGQL